MGLFIGDDMSDYNFIMPWPPSVNGYWRTFRNRQIISKRGREYRNAVYAEIALLGLLNSNIKEKLSVSVVLNPPTLRRYDVDNFTKALFDGLTNAEFWLDDEQVQRLTVTKGEKTKGGNAEVSVNVI
jgi:crossover junction endodeoxyribonuclease RusA